MLSQASSKRPCSASPSLQKNQVVDLRFTSVTADGAAVGRCQGEAVFVPLAAPGDLCRVKIVKALKTHAFGRLLEVLEPAPSRVEPDCPAFAQCGGCCFRHISYEAELELKAQQVRDALERLGGIKEPPMRPIVPSAGRDGYRNKALFPIGKAPDGGVSLGFYARNSHRIVPCGSCRLHPPEFGLAMEAFRGWAREYGDPVYDEAAHRGRMRWLYLRRGNATGEMMVCVVVNGNGLHHEPELAEALRAKVPGLRSVIINSNRERTNVALGRRSRVIWGQGHILDRLCGLELEISPLSFYQVNRDGAERLYGIAAEYAALGMDDTLVDLYCGTGTVGLSMLRAGGGTGKLIGVEIVPEAVEDARRNAERNGMANAEFICADAAAAAKELAPRLPDSGAVVVLDPPRKGCAPDLIETVAGIGPKRVVYISCNPATLARDLRQFEELGYGVERVTPVDMFPGTGHVETVCLLSKKDK